MGDGRRFLRLIVPLFALITACSTSVGGVDVILTSQPMAPGFYVIDYGAPMPRAVTLDRFRRSDPVYLRIAFGDSAAHRVQVNVAGPSTLSRTWDTDERRDLISITRQFPLYSANSLVPGRYVATVTIDGQPAGTYPFTVE